MPSLWEVLKTSKGLPAPDGFTALFAHSLSDTYTLAEISGIPPFNLGEIIEIVDYTIYGNTYQAEGVSPDNPQEVVGSGDRTGNLFDKGNATVYEAFINVNYFWFSTTDGSKSIRIPVEPDTTYTLSMGVVPAIFRLCESDLEDPTPTGIKVSRIIYSGNISEYTFTTSSTAKFLIFQGSSTVFDKWFNTLMLNEGETALPYEPYGYKIPVVTRGKNLFDRSTTEKGYRLGADGSLFREAGYEASDFIKVEPNMIVSRNKNFTITTPLCEYTKDKVFIQRITSGKTVALSSNTQYIRIAITESMLDVILNTGTTPEPYEPYIPPITTPIYLDSPLYKIGDYADSIGSKEEVRAVKELILTGGENWRLALTGRFVLSSITDYLRENDKLICYTTHYLTDKNTSSVAAVADKRAFFYFNSGNTWNDFYIKDTSFSTLDDFRAYLKEQYNSGTPVKVYYVLAAPVTETVELPEIPTLDGTTVIDVDTEVKPSNLKITYKSKM